MTLDYLRSGVDRDGISKLNDIGTCGLLANNPAVGNKPAQINSWLETDKESTSDGGPRTGNGIEDCQPSHCNMQVSSVHEHLESLRLEVMKTIRDQFQQFHCEQASQWASHHQSMKHLLQEHLSKHRSAPNEVTTLRQPVSVTSMSVGSPDDTPRSSHTEDAGQHSSLAWLAKDIGSHEDLWTADPPNQGLHDAPHPLAIESEAESVSSLGRSEDGTPSLGLPVDELSKPPMPIRTSHNAPPPVPPEGFCPVLPHECGRDAHRKSVLSEPPLAIPRKSGDSSVDMITMSASLKDKLRAKNKQSLRSRTLDLSDSVDTNRPKLAQQATLQFFQELVAPFTSSTADYPKRNRSTKSRLSWELENECYALQVVRRVVHSKHFGACVLFAILANAVFIGFHQQTLLKREIDCFHNPGDSVCSANFLAYSIIEGCFTVFFLLELVLRFTEGPMPSPGRHEKPSRFWHFITGPERSWNIFDSVLVLSSLINLTIQVFEMETNVQEAVSWVKSVLVFMRVIRLLRVMRVIRALRFFRSLRLMLASISHSVKELVWVFVLLFLIIYMFTIFIEGTITEHFRTADSSKTVEYSHAFLVDNFGSVSATIATLYMSISGGRDWQEFYFPLLKVSRLCGWIFLLFIFFVVFGVLNVVTGAFVDSMRLVSQRDNDLVIEQELLKETAFKSEIRTIFEEADADGSGTLSWEEFESHLQDDRVRAYFATLELDISEAKALFLLLDIEETDEVPIEKFINGCLRMRGDAKSIDVNMILYENEKMLSKLSNFQDFAEEMFERLDRGLIDARRKIDDLGPEGKKEVKDGRRRGTNQNGGALLTDEQQKLLMSQYESRRNSRGAHDGQAKTRLAAALNFVSD